MAPGSFVAEGGLASAVFAEALELDDPPAPHGAFDGVGDFSAGEGAVDASRVGEGVEIVSGVAAEQAGVGEGLELVAAVGWGSGGVEAGVGVAGFDAKGAWGEGIMPGGLLTVGELEAEAVAGVAGRWWGARWDRL